MSDQRKSLDEFLAENPTAQSQIDAQKAIIADAAYNQALELAASIAESGQFLHEESPVSRFGRECAAAIRREKSG